MTWQYVVLFAGQVLLAVGWIRAAHRSDRLAEAVADRDRLLNYANADRALMRQAIKELRNAALARRSAR